MTNSNEGYRALLVGLMAALIVLGLFVLRNVLWFALEPGLIGRSQPTTWFIASGVVGVFVFCFSLVVASLRNNSLK